MSPYFKVMHLDSMTGVVGAQNRTSECGPTKLGVHDLTGKGGPRGLVGKISFKMVRRTTVRAGFCLVV